MTGPTAWLGLGLSYRQGIACAWAVCAWSHGSCLAPISSLLHGVASQACILWYCFAYCCLIWESVMNLCTEQMVESVMTFLHDSSCGYIEWIVIVDSVGLRVRLLAFLSRGCDRSPKACS